ncbi:hypothetical protein [Wenyingzhuangia sp. IMCC45574]
MLGAAVYTYLHKDFWRKKRAEAVRKKQRAYRSSPFFFNYKEHYAPISVLGIQSLFDISQAKASRIKKLAQGQNLIKVKKNFVISEQTKKEVLYIEKYNAGDVKKNLVFKNGMYYEQEIDAVLPLIDLKKRKKLETYIKQ